MVSLLLLLKTLLHEKYVRNLQPLLSVHISDKFNYGAGEAGGI
jgi:hypothetical protein